MLLAVQQQRISCYQLINSLVEALTTIIGCPNLSPEVFTAESLDEQLDNAAAEYLTHPRGIVFEGKNLKLSTLFKWYASDFGENQKEVLSTLGQHVSPEIQEKLSSFDDEPTYDYDWSLNGYCSIDNECG